MPETAARAKTDGVAAAARRRLRLSLLALWATGAAAAQTPVCDGLVGDERDLATRMLATHYLYDCCDRTMAECLEQEPTCRLAVRLANNLCRRVALGQDEATIERALSRRGRSAMDPRVCQFDLAPGVAAAAGADTARVAVVEYACARCPFCALLTPALHREVTAGRLRGKVRLYFKAWPIRSHAHSKETNLGLAAAMHLGEFWPFLLHAFGHFDDFGPETQAAWAAQAGLDRVAFEAAVADPAVAARLVESKKEGLRHGVHATPTFFIDGREYVGDLGVEEMVDVLLEAWDRAAGRDYLPSPRTGAEPATGTQTSQ